MKRNYSVDFVKFLFAVLIAIGHFTGVDGIISGGNIVNLFFVMSGYFLVNSFNSGKYENTWKFTFQRIKRIYPYYIFAFIIIFLGIYLREGLGIYQLTVKFFESLPEIFMLQNIGIFPGGINYPLWQLCTLIVVSHIMFSLLKWEKNLTLNVLCPLITIGVYTYFANAYDVAEPKDWGVECQFIYIPLVRAAGNLAIGMFANYPINCCLEYLNGIDNKKTSIIVSVMGCLTIIVFFLNRGSYAIVIPFLLLLICLLYRKSIFTILFSAKIFSYFDKLSLALYLNHAFMIMVYNKLSQCFPKYFLEQNNFLYLIVLIIYSITMIYIVDYIMLHLKKIKDKLM